MRQWLAFRIVVAMVQFGGGFQFDRHQSFSFFFFGKSLAEVLAKSCICCWVIRRIPRFFLYSFSGSCSAIAMSCCCALDLAGIHFVTLQTYLMVLPGQRISIPPGIGC